MEEESTLNQRTELHTCKIFSDAKNCLTQFLGTLKQSFVVNFGITYLRRLVISTSLLILTSLVYFFIALFYNLLGFVSYIC